MKRIASLLLLALPAIFAQSAIKYSGTNVTGQLVLTGTVTFSTKAAALASNATAEASSLMALIEEDSTEISPLVEQAQQFRAATRQPSLRALRGALTRMAVASPGLPVNTGFPGSGFNGLTHRDQKQAGNGNQFNIEPPNPSIAVGKGYILEGVNNAVQVFSTAGGAPLLAQPLTSNQVFGLSPTCILDTSYSPPKCFGPYGPFLTDMRVYYDQGIDRWFVVQRGQDNNLLGTPLSRSHIYVAVSQTGDPTGTYNIYSMDTTNASNAPWCPCVSDYPSLGSDQYGFHISSNEFGLAYTQFVDVSILTISKKALAAGSATPATYRTLVKQWSGYEFTMQPAATAPGASHLLTNNGVEYFVSSMIGAASGSNLAIWAMSNTASIDAANPQPVLNQIVVPTLSYVVPDAVPQKAGTLTYGSSLIPPGLVPYIDGGDCRVQSLVYSGGRLYTTLSTLVSDSNGKNVSGAAYFVFAPSFRNGALSAFTLNQGYLNVTGNHLLRPSLAVNSRGQGAFTFTLVGPDYYPTAAVTTLTSSTTSLGVVYSVGSTIQVASAGFGPEDGFTGYPNTGFVRQGMARWGDYSTAVADSDGSVWMVAQYIPNLPRSVVANWGTYLMRTTF